MMVTMRGITDIWWSIGQLTPTEQRVRTAYPTGAEVDLRTGEAELDDPANADRWPADRTVRAEVLAALLLGAGHEIPGRVAALRLRGAHITGPLLLSHGRIAASWLLEYCRIDEHIDLEGAETGSVYLRGTHLRTLSAYNARIRGALVLSEARIDGDEKVALYADNVTIDGDLRAHGTDVTGIVSLVGADIHGQVVLTGARITNPTGSSLHAGGMRVGRSVICSGMAVVGEVRMPGVEIGSGLIFDGAYLNGAGNNAFSATSLTVAGDVSFRRTYIYEQTTRTGSAPTGAQAQPAPASALGPRAKAKQELQRFKAEGALWLPGSRIGGTLYINSADLKGNKDVAIHARRISVAGGVNLAQKLTTADEIRFTGAKIGGHLDVSGMTSPDALLTLYGVNVAGGIRDVDGGWPRRVNLDGLTYGPFDPYLPARQRVELLKRQTRSSVAEPGGYRAQPYEQLAAYYRGLGNDGQARTVLLAKARAGRRMQPWYRRVGGYFLDVLVGYGYRPSRAITWALSLLVGASVYYSNVTPTRVDSEDRSVFNPVLYTADQLIPVVRFGQPEVWQFHGAAAVVSVVLTVLGWTLGIAIAAGATRALTRN